MDLSDEERDACRRDFLARLDNYEEVLRDVIARDHFKLADGEVARDAAGRPVENPEPARQAAALLTRIAENRARLLGAEQVIVMDETSTIITVLSQELARNDPPDRRDTVG